MRRVLSTRYSVFSGMHHAERDEYVRCTEAGLDIFCWRWHWRRSSPRVAARGCAFWQEPQPQVLPPGAGLEQVIAAVNRNNSQIQALFSDSATLSGPGYPTLRAHIAYQRPRNFRLRADTGLTGPEVDLGSNDQLFWFWIKRNQPPAVYFCRHDQFPTSRARQMIPIDPNWLIEALGTLEFESVAAAPGSLSGQGQSDSNPHDPVKRPRGRT